MIWHIAKREILDNLTRFRFALTLILVMVLMVMNAVIFVSSRYPRRLAEYSEDTHKAVESLKKKSRNLGELAVKGPGDLYKSVSPLTFIATGEDANLPKRVEGAYSGGSSIGMTTPDFSFSYSWSPNWWLQYPQDISRKNDSLPNFTELDWTFIIGLVMSFMAILFTYDAISGERETGTLSLLMANSVSRATVLFGKFSGAFLTILIPLFIGVLLNLMVVNASRLVSFSGGEWVRVAIIFVTSAVYISIFLWLGLFISSQFSNSSSSLLTLLLIWIVFVVLIPNTMGVLASGFKQVPSSSEISRIKKAKEGEIDTRYKEEDKLYRTGSPSDTPPKIEVLRMWADYLNEHADAKSNINDEHLNKQFAQVAFTQQITRLSPAAVYKYALESLTGTGFVRHKRFVQHARRYRQQFVNFIRSEDGGDKESYHVYLVKEGLSQKPVAFSSIPKFSEKLTLGITFKSALLDLTLLILLSLLLFMLAVLAFLRSDVK
ncbi:MAG: ABC transporter permease subunit [Candidatus Poribacteria bacterium]|nr:ABC transporter permease subunit [Candidatus Poribacteria bacterium]